MAMIRSLSLALALAALAVPALAGPVSLLPDPTDDDGRVTLSTDPKRIRLDLSAVREDPALTASISPSPWA